MVPAITVSAEEARISVQTSVDRQRIGVGDQIVYTVTVLSDRAVEIQSPRPPDLDGFELMEAWDKTSVVRRMMTTPQGMDWQDQRQKIFNYRLRAMKPGRHSIGAFEVVVNGKTHTTQPLIFSVAATAQGGAAATPAEEDPFAQGYPQGPNFDAIDRAEEEFYGQLLRRRQQQQQFGQDRPEPQLRTLPKNPQEAFFIQVEVDKTEVYEGEQVTVSWYVYTRGQMETLDRVKFPDLRGFWKEIIEEVPTIQFTEEIVNGVPYRKALLASHALFPIKAGTAVIDEYKIKSRIRTIVQGFGGLGLGKAYEYTKSSQRVSIKVKPLPTEGRPASFTGAVGRFEVNAVVDAPSIVAHQPFNFRVRFEGNGNAKAIDLPAIQWPATLEVYDTKTDSKFFKNGRSYKQFDILLIPRQDGEVEIPAFEFSMFDPATGKYETRKTEPIKLSVAVNPQGAPAAGSIPSSGEGPSTTPRAAAPAGPQLPALVMAYSASPASSLPMGQPILWAALYLGILSVLGFKAHLEFGMGQRQKELKEIFERRWKKFEKTRAQKNHREIGGELLNLYYLVLGGIAGEKGSSEEVSKMLERVPPSLRREFGEEIAKKIEVFQVLTFAPDEAMGELQTPERMKKAIDESKKLLGTLVNRLSEVENAKG
ncbi:MAG: protein BatD [Bdellovibrionaceae bacterium]|nr:protein BatD [Pseudobdellovibrionaceae bacterium]